MSNGIVTSRTIATIGVQTITITPSANQLQSENTVRANVDFMAEEGNSRSRPITCTSRASRGGPADQNGTKTSLAGVARVMASTARTTAAAVYEVCSSNGNSTGPGYTMPVQ